MQRHFIFPPSIHFPQVIFATATLVVFVLLGNSRLNFHWYTQREPMPTQKSSRSDSCNPSQLLARKIMKGIHLCKPASLNHPIGDSANDNFSCHFGTPDPRFRSCALKWSQFAGFCVKPLRPAAEAGIDVSGLLERQRHWLSLRLLFQWVNQIKLPPTPLHLPCTQAEGSSRNHLGVHQNPITISLVYASKHKHNFHLCICQNTVIGFTWVNSKTQSPSSLVYIIKHSHHLHLRTQ